MRQQMGILGSNKGKSSSLLSSNLNNLIYCEECNKTWCELCLDRVYDDDDDTTILSPIHGCAETSEKCL